MYNDQDEHKIWNFEELPTGHFKRKYLAWGFVLGVWVTLGVQMLSLFLGWV